jgi:2-C-methyl-D-erythritol 4-phosphate cytidylyltransferase
MTDLMRDKISDLMDPAPSVPQQRHLYVIIPAAGQSRRMGGDRNKQFIPIDGIPVLVRTLIAFKEYLAAKEKTEAFYLHAIIVTSETAVPEVFDLLHEYKIPFVEKVIAGGETRQDSVWNGIRSLTDLGRPPKSDDVVFVHDGARCHVDSGTLERCLEGALLYGICTAAVPVKDTIKQVDASNGGKVLETPDRAMLYAVQTPQAFQYRLLFESYDAAYRDGRKGTDDTSLAEALGLPVYVVEGSYSNIKITTPEDLLLFAGTDHHRTHGAP